MADQDVGRGHNANTRCATVIVGVAQKIMSQPT